MKKNCIFCEKELETKDFDCIRLPSGKYCYYCCLTCLEDSGGYDMCMDLVRKKI